MDTGESAGEIKTEHVYIKEEESYTKDNTEEQACGIPFICLPSSSCDLKEECSLDMPCEGDTDSLMSYEDVSHFTTYPELVPDSRSGHESYGDNAVGWVQVQRDGDISTVMARVTPEHRVKEKSYSVQLVCDEQKEEVMSEQCGDYAASLGRCSWIHGRSEEPSPTSTVCYWKKSTLSSVGTSLKFVTTEELGKSKPLQLSDDASFLQSFVNHSLDLGATDTVLMKYFKQDSEIEKLSLHRLFEDFASQNNLDHVTAEAFSKFCTAKMSQETCKEAEAATTDQAACPLWHELRYLRITASKAYDIAHYKTMDGSLVESILGATKLKDSDAIVRGKQVEEEVLKIVEKKIGNKFHRCGLMLVVQHPFICASPYGMCTDFIIEVKCPTSSKSLKKYIKSTNEITAKYKAQVQLQMFCFKKKRCLLCVAREDFEQTKNVVFLYVDYDKSYVEDLLNRCNNFWKNTVFDIVRSNYFS